MKSIERRFNKIAQQHPEWSTHGIFIMAIEGQGFSQQHIHRWFNKLVDKDDYGKDKKSTLKYIDSLSEKKLTATKNEGNSPV
ncbi:MAG: hypothetical protein WCO55_00360 [Candidatus Falkowbacteria bacterium]